MAELTKLHMARNEAQDKRDELENQPGCEAGLGTEFLIDEIFDYVEELEAQLSDLQAENTELRLMIKKIRECTQDAKEQHEELYNERD